MTQPIPISKLDASPSNPRKTSDPAFITDLGKSIERVGLLQAILVRPRRAGRFEVVCGSQRVAAAREIKLETIAAEVRDMTDAEVRELQLIENLARADVHPMDEAESLAALIESLQATIDDVAARIGKLPAYVSKRLALLKLTKPAREAFAAGEIQIGHANLLARLTAEQQAAVMKEGLWETPRSNERIAGAWIDVEDKQRVARPVKKVDGLIQARFFLALAKAPFDLASAELVSKAGACTACPKRSSASAGLFDDVGAADKCLDPACWKNKCGHHVALLRRSEPDLLQISTSYQDRNRKDVVERGKWSEAGGTERCESARRAVVVTADDPRFATVLDVCVAKDCPKHAARYRSHSHIPGAKRDIWAERAKSLKSKIDQAARQAIFAATIKSSNQPAWRAIADALVGLRPGPELVKLLATMGWKIPTGGRLTHDQARLRLRAFIGDSSNDIGVRLVNALACGNTVGEYCYADSRDLKRLLALAKANGVNATKVRNEVTKRMTAEFEKKRDAAKAAATRKALVKDTVVAARLKKRRAARTKKARGKGAR